MKRYLKVVEDFLKWVKCSVLSLHFNTSTQKVQCVEDQPAGKKMHYANMVDGEELLGASLLEPGITYSSANEWRQ